MERWEAKLIAMFGMFAVMFFFMILPIKVNKWVSKREDRAYQVLSLLRCFAGGVFFGIIMLHMIPEVRIMLDEAWLDESDIVYPIPELIAVSGFFLIMLFERLVLMAHKRRQARLQGYEDRDSYNLTDDTPTALSQVLDVGHQLTAHSHLCHHHGNDNSNHNDAFSSNGSVAVNGELPMKSPKAEEAQENVDTSQARSIVLVLALSFECIFDGLGVGLQTSTGGVWSMFVAVISHEFVISFCLGLELTKYYSSKKVILAGLMYSLIPPVGCAIGMIITEAQSSEEDEETMTIVNGVLIALAAGVFMYCTFVGMMGEELNNKATLGKIFAMFVGCAMMAGLAALPDDTFASDEEDDIGITDFPLWTTASG